MGTSCASLYSESSLRLQSRRFQADRSTDRSQKGEGPEAGPEYLYARLEYDIYAAMMNGCKANTARSLGIMGR